MIWSTIVTVCLLPLVLAKAFPGNIPKRPELVARQVSDPCCSSCAGIQQNFIDCPPATSDIFCGCDGWVAAAPACEACIFDASFNTSFALNPGPALELFWAWCQCQVPCRSSAEAIYGGTCADGTNHTCISEVLVSDGPECECCIKDVDPWFASFFKVWIEQGKSFLETGVYVVPGASSKEFEGRS